MGLDDTTRTTGEGSGGDPEPGGGSRGTSRVRGRRPRTAVVAGALVAVLLVVAVVLAIAGGGDGDGPRLRAPGSTRGIPDASPVGRLGSVAAVTRLKERMGDGDAVSSISLTGSHAQARVVEADGSGRSLEVRELPDGPVRDEDDGSTGGGTGIDAGLPAARLDVAAPRRLLAAALRGIGPSVRPRVLEIAADSTTGLGRGAPVELEWRITIGSDSDAGTWTGDEHGEHVVRMSDGAPAPPEGEPGPAVRPSGVGVSSLVRPANLQRVLNAVADRSTTRGGVTYVGVEPGRLAVGFVEPVGAADRKGRVLIRSRILSSDAGGGIRADPVVTRRGPRDDAVGVPVAAVDPQVPLRVLRAIGRRLDQDVTRTVRSATFRIADPEFDDSPTGWHLRVGVGGRISNWRTRADGSGLRTDPNP